MIHKLEVEHKNKNTIQKIDTEKYMCIEYNNNIEYCLKKELKRHDIDLSFRTSNKLLSHFNKTEPNNKLDLSGVTRSFIFNYLFKLILS